MSTHSSIAFISGAVAVNVNTPVLDSLFSYSMALGIAIFCAKGIVGAAISVGINKIVDMCKNKKTA